MGLHIIIVGDKYQAIMGFSGALTDSMDQAKAALGEHVVSMPLTVNRRTNNLYIIEYVRDEYIPELKAHDKAAYGLPVQFHNAEEFDSIMKDLRPGDAILSRVNAPNIQIYLKLLEFGKGATILGKDNIEKIMALFERLSTDYECNTVDNFMWAVGQWQDDQIKRSRRNQMKMAIIDDQAESVRAICRGLDLDDGIGAVQSLVSSMFSNANGNRLSIINLASAHKSKGLEFPRVYVIRELDGKVMFPHPRVTTSELVTQEMNLYYPVACLRAQEELHIMSLVLRED
jgi:superfamily I DNA/RNA helicase